MSVQVSYKKQFIFGIILVLGFLLFIELISIIYISQNDSCFEELKESKIYEGNSDKFIRDICDSYHSLLYYSTDQGISFPIKYFEPNQYFENLSINEQGIRGEVIPQEKHEDVFRIFVVGGSTTFGNLASSDDTTIPGYLQFLMNDVDAEKKIEVFNLGVFGRTSFEEVFDLEKNFLQYKPDLIIVYDGWNDLYDNINKFEEGKTVSILTNFSKIFQILKQNYATFQVVLEITSSFDNQNILLAPNADNMEKKANAWVDNWESICKIGKEKNFDTIIFLQPILGTGDKPLSLWEEQKIENFGFTSVAPYYYHLEEMIPILNKKCTAAYDISKIFNDVDEPIYISMGHMGDRGNYIIASEMFTLLKYHITKELDDKQPRLGFMKSVGSFGDASEQFDRPHGMDFFNNQLFVLDTGNNRIQIFSKDLNLMSIIPINTKDPQGISVTSDKIFVADTYDYKIKSFDYAGKLLNQFNVSWTRDLEADEDFIYVLEPHKNSIQVYDHFGTEIRELSAHSNLHYLNSNHENLIASGPHPNLDMPSEVLIFDKKTGNLEQRFETSKYANGAMMYQKYIFLVERDSIKGYDLSGNLFFQYNIERGSDESLTQIETSNNIVYVLDTHGNSIKSFKIIYE
mgnify:CR=1 FL=1